MPPKKTTKKTKTAMARRPQVKPKPKKKTPKVKEVKRKTVKC